MSAPSSTTTKTATLLIVDSEASERARLGRIFEDAGHRAFMASDAPSALRLLHREPFDLVILDIEIPGVNGLALCRLLRAQAATRQLPLVVFTASDEENRKIEAFAAGADDYIVKPSSPRELLTRVGAHLETAQREWALVGTNRELQFLADLGRGLLRALEPSQVVRHVAGATYEGTGAVVCAAALGRDKSIPVICAFDREGSAEDERVVHTERLNAWLASSASSTSALLEEPERFFLRDEAHRVEYAAPLRFGGRTKGVLVVGFDDTADCSETVWRLVDAAAQQAALAAHVASLYQAARDAASSLSLEVERRTAEAEAQRRFTEAIIDSLPLSLYAVDRDYRVVAWNRNRELGGQGIPRNAVMGRNIFDVLTRQKRVVLEREFARAFETGEIERIEQETTTREGETKHWLVSKIPMRAQGDGEVSHVITVGEDITTRVEAHRAIARAEKLAAVGRLAAGVVHEINNPLATISACAEALESRVAEGAFDGSPEVEDLREYLGLIRSEAFRCKTITNGLLDFSRTRASQHVPVNVNEVIAATARLLVHQRRGEGVEITVEAAREVAPISGDAGQLQQAIIALATNAMDAMPEGGRLTLRARNLETHVLVEVSDTGVGIATENLTKIFDPFFTTKEIGQGTGLGLAVCYGIVTEHGGRLDVQSSVGVGTTFTISLPALDGQHNGEETA
ncbi:MAG TPA: ATP-binding protein [Pyrinomonadaceae bacterium]|jgi:two-component system NtrC family sensor kinase|nr:ATP-binding protein [Pyrinomonadaceae bacterium]